MAKLDSTDQVTNNKIGREDYKPGTLIDIEKQMLFLSISSFIQTFLYLTIYLVMVAHVLRKIRPMNLQKQDKITVGTFIFCQTLNLIVQCAYMVLELKENFMDSQEMIDDLLKVGQTITSNLNYFVLFFYTYQLRVVHIKLTAQTPADFNQELKKTNIIWLILFVE